MDPSQQSSSFKPEEALDTPYRKAQQEWDERIGSARVQAKNWRIATFFCLIITILSVSGMFYLSSRSTLVPYIVEVDKLGKARSVGALAEQNYVPQREAMEHFISKFVINIRSVPVDPVILKQQWLDAYAFVSGKATNMLTSYARENDPFERMAKHTITVQVDEIIAISESSYQVNWKENVFGKSGNKSRTDSYIGIFNVEFQKASSPDNLRRNPLGIYIQGFDWHKELGASE